MSSTRPKLTLWEKLDFGLAYLSTVLVVLYSLLTSPFRGKNGQAGVSKHILYAGLRSHSARASARQLQSVYPASDEAYSMVAKAKGFKSRSVELLHGARAHWIGDDAAEKILVLFHGGGYVLPAAVAHFDIGHELKHYLDSNTAVIVLSYSLAPEFPYPIQLQQATALLRYLIEEVGKRPENIVLQGDSAGANLALGVLSHILHPHPLIEPLQLSRPLRGVALISPWGDFSESGRSYQTKQYKDLLDYAVLKKWSDYFMAKAASDEYNQPFTAAAEWWRDLPSVVDHILLTAGADEVMVDGIQSFVSRLESIYHNVTAAIVPGETHDQIFLDRMIGEKEEAESKRLLTAWLKARLWEENYIA